MMENVGVVGLGYVGLPVAVAFASKHNVVGYDISSERINSLLQYNDINNELSMDELKHVQNLIFTNEPNMLSRCNYIIITVPTPIDLAKQPDLAYLIEATKMVGSQLTKGCTVIYESTVYPGTTEEICIPILEELSNLVCGVDFYIGYSPERINPGDKKHSIYNVIKVVAGQDERTLQLVADLYSSVISAGVFKAASIKVAEAAKVLENTQRDINIALMNECAMIFDKLEIDTVDVLNAARTKWNFLPFSPGLVGGHCIGVDPYYLTHKAERLGYHPQVILSGRRINDSMGKHIATALVKQMIHHDIPIQHSVVTMLGVTYKENISDIRNSKVIDIIEELQQFGIQVQICDPHCDPTKVKELYGLDIVTFDSLEPADAIVLAVPHQKFITLGSDEVNGLFRSDSMIIIDVKSVLDKQACPKEWTIWRL
jgi:UDP-N-acetyl-D-galactosamine dehydrogenase